MAESQIEYVEGTVGRYNERGFTLRERDGWLNISRYATPAPPIPNEGARVRAGIDGSGFVRTVEVLEPPPAASRPDGMPVAPAREVAVTRMACLNTATAILSSGGRRTEPADVVSLAEELERWVLRP